MTSSRRNDRARRFAHRPKAAPAADWLWGWHAVAAALGNPAREPARRLLVTSERGRLLEARVGSETRMEIVESGMISSLLPSGAAHQGVAMDVSPLPATPIVDLGTPAKGVMLMLDQITDPQNVGAIFRSAAAFGARGVILQDRHAPALVGALAKAAAGAIEIVPHARETNLSRTLDRLEELGWRAVGLDGAAADTLAEVLDNRPTVFVLGSEGEGLRRLVAEHCDALARIPMPGGFDSLNVSAAAAVTLYEAQRVQATEATG